MHFWYSFNEFLHPFLFACSPHRIWTDCLFEHPMRKTLRCPRLSFIHYGLRRCVRLLTWFVGVPWSRYPHFGCVLLCTMLMGDQISFCLLHVFFPLIHVASWCVLYTASKPDNFITESARYMHIQGLFDQYFIKFLQLSIKLFYTIGKISKVHFFCLLLFGIQAIMTVTQSFSWISFFVCISETVLNISIKRKENKKEKI